jgi:hypothetical protein
MFMKAPAMSKIKDVAPVFNPLQKIGTLPLFFLEKQGNVPIFLFLENVPPVPY